MQRKSTVGVPPQSAQSSPPKQNQTQTPPNAFLQKLNFDSHHNSHHIHLNHSKPQTTQKKTQNQHKAQEPVERPIRFDPCSHDGNAVWVQALLHTGVIAIHSKLPATDVSITHHRTQVHTLPMVVEWSMRVMGG